MNHYRTTNGKRIKKSSIDRKVREAKEQFLNELHGDYTCQSCGGSNGSDCSHIVSVDECQKSGKAEQAYNMNNLELLCRPCHEIWHNWRSVNLQTFGEIGNWDHKEKYLRENWIELHRVFLIMSKNNK